MSLRPSSYEAAKAKFKPLQRKSSLIRKAATERGRMRRTAIRLRAKKRDAKEQAWREAVLERDGYRCRWIDEETGERCPVEGAENLEAHHIHERSQRPDLRLDVDNGASICVIDPYYHHDHLHHTVAGRKHARKLGLLGTETYEKASKNARMRR